MNTVVKVEGLSKQYRLGNVGTGSLAHDVNRAWYRMLGKDDPYLKIGEENDRATKGSSDYVWALQDISFNINYGEVLGIIGRNGAGKSTLLKILSRTTSPTQGLVKLKGRVASLLEVGTGFHPELSGRDNIYLNGAILGMTKREIKKKFDEIVDFAGVERYIDTPVKRYSSGMYVRLAFGVAAHLDSEILIVDEVLAVGDAEFQEKCLGKMGEVSKGQGRTVLFVSHNMAAIQQLCTHLLYLTNGKVNYKGNVPDGLSRYYESIKTSRILKGDVFQSRNTKNKKAFLTGFELETPNDYNNLFIRIFVESLVPLENIEAAVGIDDRHGIRLITLHSKFTKQQFNLQQGINILICEVNNFYLKPEGYSLKIFLGDKYDTIDYIDEPLDFEIPEYNFYAGGIVPDSSQGYLMVHNNWSIKYNI